MRDIPTPDDESENLSSRRVDRRQSIDNVAPLLPRGPLITKAEPDFVLRTLAGIVVALLGFICIAVWNGNRELGEIKAEAKASRDATDRRITALENATDRRITALEQKVWGR